MFDDVSECKFRDFHFISTTFFESGRATTEHETRNIEIKKERKTCIVGKTINLNKKA